MMPDSSCENLSCILLRQYSIMVRDFESKAYRRDDGEIQVFRLMDNCKRLVNSAIRSSMRA